MMKVGWIITSVRAMALLTMSFKLGSNGEIDPGFRYEINIGLTGLEKATWTSSQFIHKFTQ